MTDKLKKCRKQVGIQFKLARESQGWTIEQVATMAELKPATIRKMEDGIFNYPFDVMTRVAEVLGCKITINEK